MPSIGMTVLWFLVIVAAIPLSLWMLKRSGVAQGGMGGLGGAPSLFRQVGQFNIGQGQRLVAVEVGHGDERQWLVLGVTAQSINTLHTMAPQTLPCSEDAPTMPAAFANMLQRFTTSFPQPQK